MYSEDNIFRARRSACHFRGSFVRLHLSVSFRRKRSVCRGASGNRLHPEHLPLPHYCIHFEVAAGSRPSLLPERKRAINSMQVNSMSVLLTLLASASTRAAAFSASPGTRLAAFVVRVCVGFVILAVTLLHRFLPWHSIECLDTPSFHVTNIIFFSFLRPAPLPVTCPQDLCPITMTRCRSMHWEQIWRCRSADRVT